MPILSTFPDVWQTTLDSSEFGGRLQLDTALGNAASLLWGVDYSDEFNNRPLLVSDNAAFDNNRQLAIVDDSLIPRYLSRGRGLTGAGKTTFGYMLMR
ncbi:MAG: hypothetical protein F6K31_38325 [Symploca sp. SIO2G7]|nr:hypothetical protein [Symploca sp. SIO2G7]